MIDLAAAAPVHGDVAAASAGVLRPTAFLDRDGVLNVDRGYVFRAGDLRFTPTAIEAVRRLNAAGWLAIVVTNQSGVARGFYGMADVAAFHDHLQAELARHGAHLDAFYTCPHHPDGIVPGFTGEHEDRKPAPGMLRRAMRDWPVDPARSVLIGDKDSDMDAAANAGVRGIRAEPDICDLAAIVATLIADDRARMQG